MTPASQTIDAPHETEIRAALERICDSAAFRSAPRLTAFLRFVVERALAGDGAHLKGYTIAVEALGRPSNFDPQSDPIVRVEAGRLRRALERYYESGGEPLRIDLPRGSYVPTFHYCVDAPTEAKTPKRLRVLVASTIARAHKYAVHGWLLFAAVTVLSVRELLFITDSRLPRGVSIGPKITWADADRAAPLRPRRLAVGPVVYVAPFAAEGVPNPAVTGLLRERLRDAFARFEDVTIVSEAPQGVDAGPEGRPEPAVVPPDYRFVTSVKYYPDDSANVMFQLIDTADGTIVWSRGFEQITASAEGTQMRRRMVRQTSTTLFSSFGIIHGRERVKRAAAVAIEPRYACVLDYLEYLRHLDNALHADVRACAERSVAKDPSFARGYIMLSRIDLNEYRFGLGVRTGESPADERSLAMARRAIELKPNSAHAYVALLNIQAARGAAQEAIEAGERALVLNRNDMSAVFNYGMQLVFLGEIDRGAEMIQRAIDTDRPPPTSTDFMFFLIAYLKGDLVTAARHVDHMTSDRYAPNHLARALIAAKSGNLARARQAYERLVVQNPGWHDDPRDELRKFFSTTTIVDRIATDLADVWQFPTQ